MVKTTIRIAKAAAKAGVGVIVATPHKMEGTYDTSFNELSGKVKELNNKLKKTGVKVIFGAENYAEYDIDFRFTINHKNYILIEFPMNAYPAFGDELIADILKKRLIPVIAHPDWFY